MYQNFDLKDVKIISGEFKYRRDKTKEYLKELQIDSLLYNFRIVANRDTKNSKPYGGWEAPQVGIRGHFVGHYISACSKFAYGDNDEEFKTIVNNFIYELKKCQLDNGYLSAFPESDIDELESHEDIGAWAPYYTFHKIIQGLLDAYYYVENKDALQMAIKFAYYIKGRFDKLSYWKIDGILRCSKLNPKNEYGGIGDSLYTLYDYTKDNNIFELAKLFDRDYFLQPLLEEKDLLDNLHANTHLPMIQAILHRYDITNDVKFKNIAFNFYEFLLGRIFANGNSSSKAPNGNPEKTSGKAEHWGEYGILIDKLTGGESESCCAHNTEKILNKLFRYSNDVRYLNHLDDLKFNSILSSISHNSGLSQYHQPMGVGAKKNFATKFDSFWCCMGSGIEAMSELQNNIYFYDDNKVLINSLINSELNFKNVKLKMTTNYPNSLKATLEFSMEEDTILNIILKTKEIDKIYYNNQQITIDNSKVYTEILRTFKNGDKIEILTKAELRLVNLKGSKNIVAIKYGNILLAQLGDKEYIESIDYKNLNERLERDNYEELKFFINNGEKENILFIPLYMIEDQVYTVYMNIINNVNIDNSFKMVNDGSEAYS